MIAAPGGKIPPGEQDLGHGDTATGKGVLVEGHELALADGGGGLEGDHLGGPLSQLEGPTAQAHGPAGDKGQHVPLGLLPGQARG